MQATLSLDTPIVQVEKTPSLPVGRHTGIVQNIEISDIEITEGEVKTRVVWTFATPTGTVRGYSGVAATPDSKLYAIMVNLGALGKPLKEMIGRKVGFTVSLSKTQKAKVDLATVTPA